MDHLQGYGGAIMPEPVFPFRGPPTTSGIDVFHDGPFRTNQAAFRMSLGNDGWGRQESPYDTIRKLVRNEGAYGDELRSRIAYRVTRMFRISYSTEQLPYPDNRVELSDKKDGIGLRRPKITYTAPAWVRPDGLADGAPMIRSAQPSPLTSPAANDSPSW